MKFDSMLPPSIILRRFSPAGRLAVVLLALLSVAGGSAAKIEPRDLALNKPATCSSVENEEHAASAANDGDPGTSWRADDEPEGVPDWWSVDLQKPVDLSGCQIRWPFDGMNYRYKVEGSADGKTWAMLSDRTHSDVTAQVHDLSFKDAKGIRYVKITVTGFTEGCTPSISEVKIFGK